MSGAGPHHLFPQPEAVTTVQGPPPTPTSGEVYSPERCPHEAFPFGAGLWDLHCSECPARGLQVRPGRGNGLTSPTDAARRKPCVRGSANWHGVPTVQGRLLSRVANL